MPQPDHSCCPSPSSAYVSVPVVRADGTVGGYRRLTLDEHCAETRAEAAARAVAKVQV